MFYKEIEDTFTPGDYVAIETWAAENIHVIAGESGGTTTVELDIPAAKRLRRALKAAIREATR
jgi:hypothetical protein